jgi:predicted Zn-dependent protease
VSLNDYIQNILALQRSKNYRGAYELLKEALKYYPTNHFLQGSEVFLLFRLGQVKEARRLAEERLSALKTNPFFVKTYIDCLVKDKAQEDALRVIDSVFTWGIRDEKLFGSIADILMRIADTDRAVAFLQLALMLMPQSQALKEHLSRLNNQSLKDKTVGYYRERFKDIPLQRVIEEVENLLVLPDFMEDLSLRLYLAEVYKKKGDLHKAAETYTEALKIKDTPFVRKMLGYVYYRLKDWDKAFIYLRDHFIEEPQDNALYTTMAKILQNRNNQSDAEALVAEALARHPEYKQLYGLLKKTRPTLNQ